MTREEINNMMHSVGVYYDKDHPDHIEREKLDTLPPPFMEFAVMEKPFHADNITYATMLSIEITFYSDVDVDSAEEKIKNVLTKNELPYSVGKEYQHDIGLWETTFRTSTIKS